LKAAACSRRGVLARLGLACDRRGSLSYQFQWLIQSFVVLALAARAVPATDLTNPHAREVCGQAATIAQQLTQISGMKLKHAVPCDFITKDKINQFLKDRVKDVAKPDEIRAEELTLKKFGLVPPDFDLASTTVDLLTEQAAAFYDYDKKKLFITETTESDSQEPVLAHELSHALADQSFNLGRFIRAGSKSDDGSTARLAAMEGQATWIMSEYMAHQTGRSLKDSPSLVEMMSQLTNGGGGDFPVFDNAPLYMRETLIFPYQQGMLFQNALIQHDGMEGFAEVFRRPPVSTQQIMHPEKYLANVQPAQPALPDLHLPRGYRGLVGGTLGELDEAILLEQFAGKERSKQIAPHFRGSNFELLENKKAGRVVLLYAAEWDSEDSARLYFGAYREAMAKKWKKMEIAEETEDSVRGSGDDGRFVLTRKGAVVTSVEGLDPALN
jgi:hypothetical protein